VVGGCGGGWGGGWWVGVKQKEGASVKVSMNLDLFSTSHVCEFHVVCAHVVCVHGCDVKPRESASISV